MANVNKKLLNKAIKRAHGWLWFADSTQVREKVIKRIINVKHSPLYYEDYLVFVCIEAVHQTLIGERWKK